MHPHVGQHRAYAVLRLVVSILLGHYEAQKLRRERTGRQRSEGAYLLRQRVAEDIPVIPAFDNKPSEVIHVALRAGGDVSDKSEGLLPRQEPGPFGYFRHIFDGMVDNSVETHLSLRLTDTALFQTALLRGSILSGAVYGATSLLAVFRRSAVRVLLLALTRHLPAVVQEVLLLRGPAEPFLTGKFSGVQGVLYLGGKAGVGLGHSGDCPVHGCLKSVDSLPMGRPQFLHFLTVGGAELLHLHVIVGAEPFHVPAVRLRNGGDLFTKDPVLFGHRRKLRRLGGTLALKVLHHLAVEFHVGTLWFHASKLQKILTYAIAVLN